MVTSLPLNEAHTTADATGHIQAHNDLAHYINTGATTGATGPQGAPGLLWRGVYNNATTYGINDAVSYNGSAFIAIAGTTGVNPGTAAAPSAPWGVLASGISSSGSGIQAIFESSGTYPLRSTVTSSATQRVVWVGPDAPPIGSGYALNDIDTWDVGS